MARIRRLLPSLMRHLPLAEAETRVATALTEVSDELGLELLDFSQLILALSVAGDRGTSGGIGDALVALSSVDSSFMGSGALSPLQLQRMGRITRRMQDDGYPPGAVNAVLRTLFVSSSRADLDAAFAALDRDHAGSLDAAHFRQLLHVAGERLPEDAEIDAWFAALDLDASGRLELAEFSRLMRALRRAIAAGHTLTLGGISSVGSALVRLASGEGGPGVSGAALDAALEGALSPLERRRAHRVADALHTAEFATTEIRAVPADDRTRRPCSPMAVMSSR